MSKQIIQTNPYCFLKNIRLCYRVSIGAGLDLKNKKNSHGDFAGFNIKKENK